MELVGMDEVRAYLLRVADALDGPAVDKGLVAGAKVVEARAKISLNTGTRSGRTYVRGGKPHTASARGEPPATDTGALANSLGSELVKRGVARAFTGTDYAEFLEREEFLGRPFMRPAADQNLDEILEAVAVTIGRELPK
jgi:hypothetical protein